MCYFTGVYSKCFLISDLETALFTKSSLLILFWVWILSRLPRYEILTFPSVHVLGTCTCTSFTGYRCILYMFVHLCFSSAAPARWRHVWQVFGGVASVLLGGHRPLRRTCVGQHVQVRSGLPEDWPDARGGAVWERVTLGRHAALPRTHCWQSQAEGFPKVTSTNISFIILVRNLWEFISTFYVGIVCDFVVGFEEVWTRVSGRLVPNLFTLSITSEKSCFTFQQCSHTRPATRNKWGA